MPSEGEALGLTSATFQLMRYRTTSDEDEASKKAMLTGECLEARLMEGSSQTIARCTQLIDMPGQKKKGVYTATKGQNKEKYLTTAG